MKIPQGMYFQNYGSFCFLSNFLFIWEIDKVTHRQSSPLVHVSKAHISKGGSRQKVAAKTLTQISQMCSRTQLELSWLSPRVYLIHWLESVAWPEHACSSVQCKHLNWRRAARLNIHHRILSTWRCFVLKKVNEIVEWQNHDFSALCNMIMLILVLGLFRTINTKAYFFLCPRGVIS